MALLIVPVPALAAGEDLPDASLEATKWVGNYEGVTYEVAGDGVKRADGDAASRDASAQILKAKRVHDLVTARPDFVERMAERASAEDVLADRVATAESAVDSFRHASDALRLAEAEGILEGVLGALPIQPNEVTNEANAVRTSLVASANLTDHVREASAKADEAFAAFEASHAVEDNRVLLAAYRMALPIYRDAAADAEAIAGHLDKAAADARAIADELEAQSASLLGWADEANVLSDYSGAATDLEAASAVLRGDADALRSDGAFMESLVKESAQRAFPVVWVVGGGAGAAGLGAGGLWWLRRRAGLP